MHIAARRLGIDPGRARAPQPRARPARCPTAPRPGRSTTPATTRPASTARSSWRLRRPARRAGAGPRRGPPARASAWPAWSSRASPTWATSRSCRARRGARAGLPKSGNAEGVTIAMGPHGGVTLRITTTPQGQGHRTVAAQVAADVLGLEPGADRRAHRCRHGGQSLDRVLRQLLEPLRGDGRVRRCTSPPRGWPTACARSPRRCSAARPRTSSSPTASARVRGDAERHVSLRRLAGAAHWHPSDLAGDGRRGARADGHLHAADLAARRRRPRQLARPATASSRDVCAVEIDPRDRGDRRALVRHGARRRPPAQPAAGRRPDPRRPGARSRRGAARGASLRRATATS